MFEMSKDLDYIFTSHGKGLSYTTIYNYLRFNNEKLVISIYKGRYSTRFSRTSLACIPTISDLIKAAYEL